jgi:predicted dehydrogenase
MMRRALVVGYGSIGARHARLLRELGLELGIVSRRGVGDGPIFNELTDACFQFEPDYVVIANETVRHIDSLNALSSIGFAGWTLVEKPLTINMESLAGVTGGPRIRIAYNLRFHPALIRLKGLLAEDRPIAVQAYVGQYLPDWRPGTDYRASYSANKAAGGGVLRDLSHELDYLRWLFGPWSRLAAAGGRRGDLAIDSDDTWCVLMEQEAGLNLTLQMNYLDRVARRELTVLGVRHSYRVDLIAGTLAIDGAIERFTMNRDQTYLDQHLAILSGRAEELPSFTEGVAIMATIDAIECAAHAGRWVSAS